MNKRINALQNLIDIDDNVIDIGCDHGYLAIFLKQLNPNRKIIASDVNESALHSARLNIKKKKLDIPTVLSDGLENIDVMEMSTAVIAGVGTHTIKKIIQHEKFNSINTIIIQANNEHEKLRIYMNELNYSLIEEHVIKEGKHYYIIMKYIHEKQILDSFSLLYGIHQNEEYLLFLKQKKEEILEHIPKDKQKREQIMREIKLLELYFKEKK